MQNCIPASGYTSEFNTSNYRIDSSKMLDTRDRNDQQLHLEEHPSSSAKSPASDDHGEVDKSAHREQADTTNSDSSLPASNSSVAGITSNVKEGNHRTGRWTPDEKILFLYGLKRFGKGRWKKMSIYLPHRYVQFATTS